MFGKSIKLFLIEGDPNGRMTCELSNWSGKAYKIPRIKVKVSYDREDLKGTGVYLLFGKNEESKDLIYIGEAESVIKRLNQHLAQKEFWNETIIFISKDENLNKAHIKYLEHRLYDIAKSVNRYSLENTSIPTKSSISESDRAEMEEFIANIRMLVTTLGHKVFEEKREPSIKNQSIKFYIDAARGADARGEQTSDGFVVLKDSKAAKNTVKSMAPSFKKLRATLIEKKDIVTKGDELVFSDDYIFSSPSTAAAVVMGRNANGLKEWKTKKGKSIKDYEDI